MQQEQPIIRRTTDRDIFKSMDLATLTIQRRNYIRMLKDPNHVADWPAFQMGKQLLEDELTDRGIEVPKEA
jgi:hypothetical protein